MATSTDPASLRAGRGVWIGVVAGLGFVVAANAAMISIAVRNPPALETEDHYGDAMRYDEVIASRERTRALGWKVGVAPCTFGDQPCRFVLDVVDADGEAVSELTGQLELRRADTASFDRVASFTPDGPGRYAAELELGAGGLYEIALDLRGPDGSYVEQRRIVVKEGD